MESQEEKDKNRLLNLILHWRLCRQSEGRSRSGVRSRVTPASPAPPETACRGIPAGDRRRPAWAARRWCARAAIAERRSLFGVPPKRFLRERARFLSTSLNYPAGTKLKLLQSLKEMKSP